MFNKPNLRINATIFLNNYTNSQKYKCEICPLLMIGYVKYAKEN